MTEDEAQKKTISRLRRDALATVADLIDCCRAWGADVCILGNVRAGDALAALNSLLRIADDREKLRAFAVAIMESWPDGGIEGDDLQETAVKHGMLAPEIRHEPCGEWCNCNAGVDVDGGEWERGVECYRRTALLMGEAE